MLPHLTMPDGAITPAVAVPPPPHFRPLVGPPRVVKLGVSSWNPGRDGDTTAKTNGLRYEDKVQRELVLRCRGYLPSPPIHFLDDNGYRTIIPDGLISNPGRVFIFEIKSQHMPEAWWQLDQLYKPVLTERRVGCPISCIEICRSYDPAMPFPIKPDVLSSFDEVLTYQGNFAVLPWRL